MQARSDGISATTVERTRVDLGATVARPGGASLRSARGASLRSARGVPRFARHGGASLRSAWGCLASLGGWVPLYRSLSLNIATKIYGFRNDCSRLRSVRIAICILQYSVARNFCKQAKIRVRLALHFPLIKLYTKRYGASLPTRKLSPRNL